jgi:predicted SprT family Zn-dependent metalloprotease
MKYICNSCQKLTSSKDIIRMPFQLEVEYYYCIKCYKKWAKPIGDKRDE